MKDAMVMWVILIIFLVVLIPFGVSSCNDSRSRMVISQANADAIRWEAQARASAITIAASTPVIVFGGVFIIALAVVALGIVAVTRRQAIAPQPQIIERITERQIIYLPPPGQRRGDTWRAIGKNALPSSNTLTIAATAITKDSTIEN